MSGGFFRGTSADQDTRFSNKMSKLLKTQKFAPELDVIIEMAKVKMDVIRPWIATRVTELLGFEDEVLINFIYGLLDVKEADGKHLQIQLTGFMEKNTGRFMKELWSLLASAQSNISGIPQQFLDAKAEEAKKKKDEKERILSEVQRKKEEQEKDAEERREQERLRKLSAPQESTKRSLSTSPGKRGGGEGDGHGGRNGRSQRRSPLSPRGSGSSSESLSRGSPVRRRRSRSLSRSPRRRRRSGSPFRRRSPVPPRSPPRRRRSPVYSRSPPRRRKSPPPRSPPRYRSRTPPRIRRRSPVNVLSPPRRHAGGPRSPPLRRRSPSLSVSPPVARRSSSRSPHPRGRSPSRDRVGRRSRSPFQRRKSPNRHRGPRVSRSPFQRRRSPTRDRELGLPANRSPYRKRRSPSRDFVGGRRNGFDARDRERPVRDGERLERRNERVEKRDHSEQRPLYNREQERISSRDGRDGRPPDSVILGEKRSHKDLEEEAEPETAKREKSDFQDIEGAPAASKIASGVRAQADSAGIGIYESKGAGEGKESVAGPAVDSEDEDHEPVARPQKSSAGVKDVVDAGDDEDGSESPGSSEERHEAKRRRKEEKRLRKEEKRRRREEKHRRKEEKRAAKSSKAGVDEDDGNGILDGRLQNEDDDHQGSREVFGPREVYRKKDDEMEDEQKRIEKELRNKALESLRAKKGIAC